MPPLTGKGIGQDEHMLAHRCAFCGNKTHFTARAIWLESRKPGMLEKEGYRYNGYSYRGEVAATCDTCQRFNTARGATELVVDSYEAPGIHPGNIAVALGAKMKDVKWSPPSMLEADTRFLPENVGAFLQEAHNTVAVGAYRGTLLLVRSVIEATAKDRGITKGNLLQKIDALREGEHIRSGTKDMAHALRILGNDMAHGDIAEAPTEEDAIDALTIAQFVLDDVYVADARRADMLERRGK